MRILLLTTHLNAGGIGSYLLSLTKGLVELGHQVFVASSGGNMEELFQNSGAKLLKLNIKTKSELDPKIYFALKPLRKFIQENKIDIIHAHTRITQVMGQILKKQTGKVYISTCHGYFKTRLIRKIFPCWGDQVIAISEAVKKHLSDDFKVPTEKIVLIENGINLQDFPLVTQNERIDARNKLGLGVFPVVGIIARLSPVKGQDILIKAVPYVLEKFSSAKFLIVGDGKTEQELKSLVLSFGVGENVVFLPVVNKTREILAAMDVFVMPSRQEGLGLSIIEAQACGIPVVASRVGGIVSLIEHNKTGLMFESEDYKNLANQIIVLLSDLEAAKKFANSARLIVEKRFSQELMIEKLIGLYQKVKGSSKWL